MYLIVIAYKYFPIRSTTEVLLTFVNAMFSYCVGVNSLENALS